MRFLSPLSPLAALALMATTAAHAGTITDDFARLDLYAGDVFVTSDTAVSADYAVDSVYLSGGAGYSPLFALDVMNGAERVLFAQTDVWTLEGGTVLSFLFDLDPGTGFGDWLTLTLRFDEAITSPIDSLNDLLAEARMVITTGTDAPAPVPLPAALPLLLSALAAAGTLARRRHKG